MRYRMKNQDLQKTLDEFSNGELNKRLSESIDPTDFFLTFTVEDGVTIRLGLDARALMPNNYNPHKWNRFPDVTPPEGVEMRVQFLHYDCLLRNGCAVYEKGRWMNEYGRKDDREIAWFRPWEDPDEEDEE